MSLSKSSEEIPALFRDPHHLAQLSDMSQLFQLPNYSSLIQTNLEMFRPLTGVRALVGLNRHLIILFDILLPFCYLPVSRTRRTAGGVETVR